MWGKRKPRSNATTTPGYHACVYCGAIPANINFAAGNGSTVPPHTLCDSCLVMANAGTLDVLNWWMVSPASPPALSKSPNQYPSYSLKYTNPGRSRYLSGLPPIPPPNQSQTAPYLPESPRKSPLEVVQLEGPVIGYRGWAFGAGGGVHGAVVSKDWPKGVCLATCDNGHYSPVPDPDCHCGLYGWKDLNSTSQYGEVVGAVQLWGRLIEHGNDGWRAEKGRILAFLGASGGSKDGEKRIQQAAEFYGVPVFEKKESLLLMAKELAI